MSNQRYMQRGVSASKEDVRTNRYINNGIKILMSLFLSVYTHQLFAQDKIITTEGEIIIGYNVEIGTSSIFYQTSDHTSSATERIGKNKVLMIKRQDGTKAYISTPKDITETEEPNKIINTGNSNIKELNDNIRQRYNTELIPLEDKNKGEKAKVVFIQLWADDESQFADTNIEIEYETQYVDYNFNTGEQFLSPYMGAFQDIASNHNYPQINITIKNRSDKTIYLDLGNTFFIRDKEPYAYYQPSTTSVTTGSTKGGSLNAGAITNALGIGGFAGTLSNGITVGGANNKSTTTTTYAQRIIAIPPMSSKQLDNQLFFSTNQENKFGQDSGTKLSGHKTNKHWQSDLFINTPKKMAVGEEIIIDQSESLHFSFMITYSQDESIKEKHSIQSNFFIRKLVGGKKSYFYKIDNTFKPLSEDKNEKDIKKLYKKYVRPLWFTAMVQ